MTLSIVILAAGLSSRFGGEPKMLSKVGPNNETLFEISMTQVSKYFKIDNLYLVVGPHNIEIIKTSIQKEHLNCNLTIVTQTEPKGTAHALNTVSNIVKTPFLLMNSDDLYGEETFEKLKAMDLTNLNYVIGYPLGVTLDTKPANRAFIEVNKEKVTKLQEKMGIRKQYYSENDLQEIIVSVNLFYLQPEVLSYIKEYVINVSETTNEEIMLPKTINEMIKYNEIELKLMESEGDWCGVTYQDDILSVKKSLKHN